MSTRRTIEERRRRALRLVQAGLGVASAASLGFYLWWYLAPQRAPLSPDAVFAMMVFSIIPLVVVTFIIPKGGFGPKWSRCPYCGYDLRGSYDADNCPECGAER